MLALFWQRQFGNALRSLWIVGQATLLTLAIARPATSDVDPNVGALIDSKCPGAVLEIPVTKSKDVVATKARRVTKPKLRSELLKMAKRDQDVRAPLYGRADSLDDSDPLIQKVRKVDAANSAQLREIVTTYGFPSVDMIGKRGVKAAWLLLQHADAELQRMMIPRVENAVHSGELSGADFAMLWDRVLVASGQPQRFGTQFDDKLEPYAIEDERNVDSRRKAVGLGPLADYACIVRAMYHKDTEGSKTIR